MAKGLYEQGTQNCDETRLRWAAQILASAVKTGATDKERNRSLVALGKLRLEGAGVVQSTDAAAGCFERAAERGYPQGALAIGRLHWEKRGDVFKAYVWFRVAHTLATANASYSLSEVEQASITQVSAP